MPLSIKGIFVIFLVINQEVSSNPLMVGIQAVDLASSIIYLLQNTANSHGDSNIFQDILDTVHMMSTSLEEIGMNLQYKLDDISINLPVTIRRGVRIDAAIDSISRNMRDINYYFKTHFVNFFEKGASAYTLQSFISTVTSVGKDSPQKMAENIYSHFDPGETGILKDGFLVDIVTDFQTNTRCDQFLSPQEWLHEVYSLIAVIEMRAFTMITAAFTMRSASTGENHKTDIDAAKDNYVRRMNNYLSIMKKAFTKLPTDIRRCDAENQQRGVTFIELEKLVQIFILNTDQVTPDVTCPRCNDIKEFREKLITQKKYNHYPLKGTCNGTISNCVTWPHISSIWGTKIRVCLLPEGNNRRYEWVKVDSHEYGDITECSQGNIISQYAVQHHAIGILAVKGVMVSRPTYSCYYCVCTCVETGYKSKSIRKFNPASQISDYENNMVVIGVQFIKSDDNIIHIQITEGELMAGGKIFPGSERLVPIKKSGYLEVGTDTNYMDLDDFIAPEGSFVVIGVKFTTYSHNSEKAIGLQVLLGKIDFNEGVVDSSDINWINNIDQPENYHSKKKYLDITNGDNPLKSSFNSPDSENGQWIKFQPSSLDKDAGQTVIPFLDVQPVVTNPPFPLSGIGLFHKGKPGFGGFVALRIFTLNMTYFIGTN